MRGILQEGGLQLGRRQALRFERERDELGPQREAALDVLHRAVAVGG